ncbi:MAG: Sua5/YciO/YrdC/YwlC family protein [archaeon]
MSKEVFEEIKKISGLLNKNKLGIFPCKNSYMIIGSSIGSSDKKIRVLKEKKIVKPLVRVILDLSEDKKIFDYYRSLPQNKKDLVDVFRYSDLIFASVEKKIGFTFASNPYERYLLKLLKNSIYASSANISGEPTQFSVKKLSSKIKKSSDFILDVGDLPPRGDFAVLNLDNLTWLREGASTKTINSYLGKNNL